MLSNDEYVSAPNIVLTIYVNLVQLALSDLSFKGWYVIRLLY